jgi:hypothetical protein
VEKIRPTPIAGMTSWVMPEKNIKRNKNSSIEEIEGKEGISGTKKARKQKPLIILFIFDHPRKFTSPKPIIRNKINMTAIPAKNQRR